MPPSLVQPPNKSVDASLQLIPPINTITPVPQAPALSENYVVHPVQQPPANPTVQTPPSIEPLNNTLVSKDKLIDPDEVIQKYPKLQSGGILLAGRLAVRLAASHIM